MPAQTIDPQVLLREVALAIKGNRGGLQKASDDSNGNPQIYTASKSQTVLNDSTYIYVIIKFSVAKLAALDEKAYGVRPNYSSLPS